jgi:hypothetical protein
MFFPMLLRSMGHTQLLKIRVLARPRGCNLGTQNVSTQPPPTESVLRYLSQELTMLPLSFLGDMGLSNSIELLSTVSTYIFMKCHQWLSILFSNLPFSNLLFSFPSKTASFPPDIV